MEERRQSETQPPERWHLKKEVSIGHLLTTATVAGYMLLWMSHIETQLALHDVEIHHAKESDARLEINLKESVNRIEASLLRIEQALKEKEDKKR